MSDEEILKSWESFFKDCGLESMKMKINPNVVKLFESEAKELLKRETNVSEV